MSATDYQTAVTIVQTERAGEAKTAKLNALGKGTVRLRITDSHIREHVRIAPDLEIDAFDWIRFEGERCDRAEALGCFTRRRGLANIGLQPSAAGVTMNRRG